MVEFKVGDLVFVTEDGYSYTTRGSWGYVVPRDTKTYDTNSYPSDVPVHFYHYGENSWGDIASGRNYWAIDPEHLARLGNAPSTHEEITELVAALVRLTR